MSLRISLITIAALNRAYENIIKTIHDIDPQRMIFIAPRLRRAGRFNVLKLPGVARTTCWRSGIFSRGGR
jgi:hypothetical protein